MLILAVYSVEICLNMTKKELILKSNPMVMHSLLNFVNCSICFFPCLIQNFSTLLIWICFNRCKGILCRFIYPQRITKMPLQQLTIFLTSKFINWSNISSTYDEFLIFCKKFASFIIIINFIHVIKSSGLLEFK